MKYLNILVLVLYPFTFPAFSLIILISLLKRLCPCSFSHKEQHKHIAVTRTLLSIVRIIHNPFLNADFPWHGNDVTVSIHVFFKVTTICALCFVIYSFERGAGNTAVVEGKSRNSPAEKTR